MVLTTDHLLTKIGLRSTCECELSGGILQGNLKALGHQGMLSETAVMSARGPGLKGVALGVGSQCYCVALGESPFQTEVSSR